jgi:FtsP/CotA-like multicopper oxidase with cupredoxin domain
MLNRRKLLALGGMAGGGAMLALAGQTSAPTASQAHAHMQGPPGTAPQPPVKPFSVRMPIPQELRPTHSTTLLDSYEVAMQPAHVEIIPGMRTPMLTYGGGFVGPTIRARAGRRTLVRFRNELPHAANVHLHGGHVSPENDGYPTDLVQPGTGRIYDYPNNQDGATLWYHDHTHHMEAEHVYRGLHGFYLLEGDDERGLGLPTGRYDVPIMLSDAHFGMDGSLVWNPEGGWFDRTNLLANGKVQPYFPVAARKYRFRLLNAATHRHFKLDIGGETMIQIAGDGGLLPAPVHRTDLMLTPGERAEVVIDFSKHKPGEQVVLWDAIGAVVRFDVVERAPDDSRVPDRLRTLATLPAATVTRDVALSTDLVNVKSLINGQLFDPNRVDFRIRHGDSEIWRITNKDNNSPMEQVEHNFHIHLVQFRVLDRNGNPPALGEEGLKDTVVVGPGDTVRVQATFRGYRGRYVHHCHILEHSQFGMMGQFEVV